MFVYFLTRAPDSFSLGHGNEQERISQNHIKVMKEEPWLVNEQFLVKVILLEASGQWKLVNQAHLYLYLRDPLC